jgi:transcriptional regulator with XRE-family HTH domain
MTGTPDSDFAANLRLLCSYGRSISDICRQLGINRQQFSRYVGGSTRPSLSTLRRICDFFGIDEHEILLDREAFRKVTRSRPPALGTAVDPYRALAERLGRSDPQGRESLRRIEGCYHAYYMQRSAPRRITRYFMRFYERHRQWCSLSLERHANGASLVPRVMRYDGLLAAVGDKIFAIHRTRGLGSWWTTAFQLPAYDPPVALAGLTMGVKPETAQPVCMRVLLIPIASGTTARQALKACGSFALGDPSLPEAVAGAVMNDVAPGDIGFVSRM